MDALRRIARAHGVKLIEDAAHAFGGTHKGRKIGNGTADFTCFSFQAIKQITTIDGGLLACADDDQASTGSPSG
jgi:perosamine synthetase